MDNGFTATGCLKHALNQIRDGGQRVGERPHAFSARRRRSRPVLNQLDASPSGSPGHGCVVRRGAGLWPAHHRIRAEWNDGTDGLMRSLNVVDEPRSIFFGVGLNARCLLSNVSPPNPCRHARGELRDRLIDGSFAVWRVDR